MTAQCFHQRVRFLLVVVAGLSYQDRAASQLVAYMNGAQKHISALEEHAQIAKDETSRFQNEYRIKEGPCADLYRPLKSDLLVIPAVALTDIGALRTDIDNLAQSLHPVLSLEQEIDKRRSDLNQIDTQAKAANAKLQELNRYINQRQEMATSLEGAYGQAERQLSRVESGQTAGIREVLLARYRDRVEMASSEKDTVDVITTLFGSFVAKYPGALRPETPAEMRVLFVPSVFAGDLWPNNLSVGVSGYSSEIGEYVNLKEQFGQQGRSVAIRGGESIFWTWTMETPPNFSGVSFDINLQVSRSEPDQLNETESRAGDQLGVQMPISIAALPEGFGWPIVLLSGFFSGAMAWGILSGIAGAAWRRWQRRKEERKPRIITPREGTGDSK